VRDSYSVTKVVCHWRPWSFRKIRKF
jgi:hypothetical protein